MADKERPRNDSDGGGGGDFGGGTAGDDDDDDPEEKKCKGCGKKGKRVFLFRSRKCKKLKDQRRKQKGVSVNSGCWGRRVGGGGVCLKKPRTLVDSSGESPTSDPNSPEFTFDMLRALIEKNDFYSNESNPHLDSDC